MQNSVIFSAVASAIRQSLNHVVVGSFGVNVETMTEPKMNKGGRCGVEPNPFYGRVKKHTIYSNTAIGCDYENCCNNAANRKEDGSGTMETEKPKGRTKVDRFMSVSDKDSNQFYLDIPLRPNGQTKITSTFLVDGKPATDKQMAVIKQYLPKEYESQKQTAIGLHGAEQVQYRAVKVENVISIAQGAKVCYKQNFGA